MAKTTGTKPKGKDNQMLIVLLGLIISISIVIFLWKYYDSKMLDMERNVGIKKPPPEAGIIE